MKDILLSFDFKNYLELLSDSSIPKKETRSFQLIFLIEGKVRILTKQENSLLQDNDVIIINKNEVFELRKESEHNLFLVFNITDSLFARIGKDRNMFFSCNSTKENNDKYDTIINYLHQIVQIILLQEKKTTFLQYSIIFQLLNELLTNFVYFDTLLYQNENQEQKYLDFVLEHYHENITLESLSKEFFLQPTYISKLFKKITGYNFKDYLTDIRLNHAQNDLSDTTHSIARIAIDNGFSNINSFYRAFKKRYEETPSDYRLKTAVNYSVVEDYSEISKKYYRSINTERKKNDTLVADNYIINSKNAKEELLLPWNLAINIGGAGSLLGGKFREQFSILEKYAKFSYIRIWDLFTERMYCDWDTGRIINYDKINQVFDFFKERNIKPWIQLNRMHEIDQKYQLIDMDIQKWMSIFRGFLQHIINRYGRGFLGYWKFELTLNNPEDELEQSRYFNFYEKTSSVIRQINSSIEIGGCGFKILDNNYLSVSSVIKKMKKFDVDFYSFSLFPYSEVLTEEKKKFKRNSEPEYIKDRMKEIDEFKKMDSKKKYYISEWGNTVSRSNLLNDTLYKGSYIIKNSMDMLGHVDGLVYWSALDINELVFENSSVLNGGPGLISRYGFAKPSLLAINFLNQVSKGKLIFRDKNILGFDMLDGEKMIIGHNYNHPNQIYFLKEETKILPRDVSAFFKRNEKQIEITLKDIENGSYEVSFFFCDNKNGNIFERWKELDFLEELRASELEYLKECNPVGLRIREIEVKNKHLTLEYNIESNQIFLIIISLKTNFV